MNHEATRHRMVDEQLMARGVRDARVLEAMRLVPRHLFVPSAVRDRAYEDHPLPIGEAQTISQPYMVAVMSEALALAGGERVLEVGTGSGYQAAVLAVMGVHVVTVERLGALAERARAALVALGLDRQVRVEVGDGTLGVPAAAPYDGILVTAGGPQIPRPLVTQLAVGGRLVLPMGDEELQALVRLQRRGDRLVEEYLGECRFVKLHGAYGWEDR
jgi:protein-L-isoaspartate(D-aspartate) O-methyltransferase